MKEPLLSICHVSEGMLLASQKRKALSSLKGGLETGKTQREGAVFMPRWKSPSIRLISYSLPHTQIRNCVCFISQVLGVGKEFSMWVLVCVCVCVFSDSAYSIYSCISYPLYPWRIIHVWKLTDNWGKKKISIFCSHEKLLMPIL